MRKMVLLRWSAGAVGAGEGRVPSRDCVGRGKVPVSRERGVRAGRRLVGRCRA